MMLLIWGSPVSWIQGSEASDKGYTEVSEAKEHTEGHTEVSEVCYPGYTEGHTEVEACYPDYHEGPTKFDKCIAMWGILPLSISCDFLTAHFGTFFTTL